ncbi:MAG TPA: HPF/RaiA family ribosome-associated protein [Candidatus Paceibacterota bacterium]|jgi:putative sigma-54 modulation protein|nr:HPF/RaiA family ribosome-associated protein [Candidatus Paceibacterota bacterium]
MIKKLLKGTGIGLTPAIDAAVDKVVRSLDTYVEADDTSAIADIEVGKTTNHHRSGDIFRAEINFHSRHGDLRAEAEKEDLYVALAAAKDELIQSLRSRKSKRADFVRRSGIIVKNMLRGLPWKKGKQ